MTLAGGNWRGDCLSSWLLLVVQSLSPIQLFAIPWTAAHWSSQSFTISWSLFKLMSVEAVMPSEHLILCRPLLLLRLIFPSFRVFSNESALCQNIGASASVLAMSIQDLFPFGLTGLITLLSKGLSKVSSAPQFKSIDSSAFRLLYGPTLISVNDYQKNRSLTRQTFVGK